MSGDGKAGDAGHAAAGDAAAADNAGHAAADNAGAAGTSSTAPRAARAAGPGLLARLGLAITHPRWALAIAGDRSHAGRSGSDLMAALLLMLAATQLRGITAGVWLGTAIAPGYGARAVVGVLTRALVVDLAILVIAALVLYALAGARRNLGRAFDLACVAVLPLVFVEVAATVIVRTLGANVPLLISWVLSGAAYAWTGALVALAVRQARAASVVVPAPPAQVVTPARRAGLAITVVVALGLGVQLAWITHNVELVKPMKTGDTAPSIALAEIDPAGQLAAPVTLESLRGKVVVLDFWATWCGPCLVAMPKLEKLSRAHDDVFVVAINLDHPAAARTLFDQRGYTMKLLADDGDASQRYGVSSIPHSVVIDRRGMVRHVLRGNTADLAALVEAVRGEP